MPSSPHRPVTAEPDCKFTIPSIYDDTVLECRVYLPDILSEERGDGEAKWRKKGIVIAHPYAPMGGCCDDRVVGITVEEFLGMDYVVGTFNFRGAGNSKARTSWTGRPELDDYISFAAYLIHYVSFLCPFPFAASTLEQSPITSRLPNDAQKEEDALIVLGGYSYGSLVAKHLPSIADMLKPFAGPDEGTAAAEIILKAKKMAEQCNLKWLHLAQDFERQKQESRVPTHAHTKNQGSGDGKLCVTMGGEETSPEIRRPSREMKRSGEGSLSRKSVEIGRRMRSFSKRGRTNTPPQTPPNATAQPPMPTIQAPGHTLSISIPTISYLLISPLLAPISALIAAGLGTKFWAKARDSHHENLIKHRTLAVFGGQDVFTSRSRVAAWGQKLASESNGRFACVEVDNAGHFWFEPGVEERLREVLKHWGKGLVSDKEQR